ncbi:MAG: hypothetical protein QGG64_02055, partial [Candidatus Latescibacteria bacterium]|nr:hypothetical protein [Candidatus Latescibacterota bacterium]
MTTDLAINIRTTLISMFDTIEKKENIAEHLLKLDDLQRGFDKNTPVQFRHFLEHRSYAKALEYLEAGIVIDDP